MKRILLAGDDASLRALIRATLGTQFALSEAINGGEAIALAHQLRPDLLILQAHLPIVEGFTVCRALRASPLTRDLPIVMIGERAGAKLRRNGIELDGYLQKPLIPSQLLRLIGQILQPEGSTAAPSPPASDQTAMPAGPEDISLDFVQTLSYARELGTLYESARRQAARFRHLLEIGRDLVSARELDAVLLNGMEQAIAFSQHESGSVLLLEGPAGPLVVRAAAGPWAAKPGTRIDALDRSIAGRALRERRPIVVVGRGVELGIEWRDYTKEIASAICLPLLTPGGGTIGALALNSLVEVRKLDAHDVDALELLAALMAASIESAQLHEQLHDLVGRLFVAQEEERRRVAYDVHDGLAQIAASAHQHLQGFASQYHPRSPKARTALNRSVELAQLTVREARRVIADLRPTALDDFGLATAIRLEVEALQASGWEIRFEEALGGERVPSATETALFRVTQEALSNVRKHAGETPVYIRLAREHEALQLEVRDWGRGFHSDQTPQRAGPGDNVGLAGMRERISSLGGDIAIASELGKGTRIIANVPISFVPGHEPQPASTVPLVSNASQPASHRSAATRAREGRGHAN
ncbi:MAG: hypothetical protein QOF51_2572 [Chloroflexota bacterium]|nr:hypothetical protein [Chloroflexota bacterium]